MKKRQTDALIAALQITPTCRHACTTTRSDYESQSASHKPKIRGRVRGRGRMEHKEAYPRFTDLLLVSAPIDPTDPTDRADGIDGNSGPIRRLACPGVRPL